MVLSTPRTDLSGPSFPKSEYDNQRTFGIRHVLYGFLYAGCYQPSKGYASYLLNPESNTPNVLMKTGEDTKMQNTIGTKDSYRRTTIEAQLSYVRNFGEHKLSALAFYNQYESSNEVSIPKR